MKAKIHTLIIMLASLAGVHQAVAQGTAFTYQGQIQNNGSPANGAYNFTFTLFNTNTNGVAIAGPITNEAVMVANGLFTALIDFGPGIFTGSSNWLQIGVETNNGASSFTTLTPRQQLTPTPYALTAANVTQGAGLSGTFSSAVVLNNSANQLSGSFTGNGANVTNVNAASVGGLSATNFWQTSGNSGTTRGVNFVGTTDNEPLVLEANNQPVFSFWFVSNGVNQTGVNVIGGSGYNAVESGYVGATIAGGGFQSLPNVVSANYGTVGGGSGNLAGTPSGAAGGTDGSTVGGGSGNTCSGNYSTIGGGFQNKATNAYATVPGGQGNIAGGLGSFAAGVGAQAVNNGSFVWSDGSASTSSYANGQFTVRASGGVYLFSSSDDFGVYLPAGSGTWYMLSDRNSKGDVTSITPLQVLDKLAEMPITEWSYKTEQGVRHIGPMAQDFYAAFGMGEDNRHIATVDEDGVALAAIQGLNQKENEKDAEIQNLKKQIDSLAEQLEQLKATVKTMVERK